MIRKVSSLFQNLQTPPQNKSIWPYEYNEDPKKQENRLMIGPSISTPLIVKVGNQSMKRNKSINFLIMTTVAPGPRSFPEV